MIRFALKVLVVIAIAVLLWLGWGWFHGDSPEPAPPQPTGTGEVQGNSLSFVSALGISPLLGFFLWIFLVVLLPLLTPFALQGALEKKSNLASFVLIGGYTVLDLLVALLAFVGFSFVPASRIVLIIVLGALCALYNWRSCERLASK